MEHGTGGNVPEPGRAIHAAGGQQCALVIKRQRDLQWNTTIQGCETRRVMGNDEGRLWGKIRGSQDGEAQ